MGKISIVLIAAGLVGAVPIATYAQTKAASSAPAKPAGAPADERANFFPPKMQSFPLYGDAAIPNSKPGPDEESGADKGWIQKVSRPMIQVYLPAKAKATGAAAVVFPGGGYAGLTWGRSEHVRSRLSTKSATVSTVSKVEA